MNIVDAQVHIWSGGIPHDFPWQRQVPAYTADELLQEMDEAGVDKAVITPPIWVGDNNDDANEAARAHPNRLAIMGRIELTEAQTRPRLATWRDQPGMLGLRLSFTKPEERNDLEGGGLEWLWSACEEYELPVMMLGGDYLSLIGQIAEQHPRLQIAIDHLGLGRGTGPDAFANFPQLLSLAKHPNVAVKATAVPAYTKETFPYAEVHPYLRQVYEAFGARRIFWGSDFTRLPSNSSYRECVQLFTDALDWLPDSDRELILGQALTEWARWEIAA